MSEWDASLHRKAFETLMALAPHLSDEAFMNFSGICEQGWLDFDFRTKDGQYFSAFISIRGDGE